MIFNTDPVNIKLSTEEINTINRVGWGRYRSAQEASGTRNTIEEIAKILGRDPGLEVNTMPDKHGHYKISVKIFDDSYVIENALRWPVIQFGSQPNQSQYAEFNGKLDQQTWQKFRDLIKQKTGYVVDDLLGFYYDGISTVVLFECNEEKPFVSNKTVMVRVRTEVVEELSKETWDLIHTEIEKTESEKKSRAAKQEAMDLEHKYRNQPRPGFPDQLLYAISVGKGGEFIVVFEKDKEGDRWHRKDYIQVEMTRKEIEEL